jgi:RecB family exonuclease
MYRQCPLRYKFYYVDRLIKQYRKDWPHLSFGDSIHSALREFYRIPSGERRNWEQLEQLYRQNWNRKGFATLKEEREWGLKGLAMLKAFYEREDHSVMPLLLEETLNACYQTINLCGRIDRVDPLLESGCAIIDYKTGKETDFEEDDKTLAAAIYKYLVEHCRQCKVVKVINYYLDSGKKVVVLSEATDIKRYLDSTLQVAEAITTDAKFLPRITKLCKWCDFLEICPSRAEIIKQVEDLPF